jgi:hypothetical protein
MAVPRLADKLLFYLLDPSTWACPRERRLPRGVRQTGKGRSQGAAIGGPGRLRQRSREPPGLLGSARVEDSPTSRLLSWSRAACFGPTRCLSPGSTRSRCWTNPSPKPSTTPVDLIVPGRGHLVRRAAPATRYPLGASGPRQDRPSSSAGGPGSRGLRHQGNQLKGSPVVTAFSSLLKAGPAARQRTTGTGEPAHHYAMCHTSFQDRSRSSPRPSSGRRPTARRPERPDLVVRY